MENVEANSENLSSETRPLVCIIEAYSKGERRALAMASLREVNYGHFRLAPFLLREIAGCDVVWTSPSPGEAISEAIGFSEAIDALSWWATFVMATTAHPFR